jgi:hypothetical protein
MLHDNAGYVVRVLAGNVGQVHGVTEVATLPGEHLWEYIGGVPPQHSRRPWRLTELALVLEAPGTLKLTHFVPKP